MSDVIEGVVRVIRRDGTTAGTGFLASDDRIVVTCAHVIDLAGSMPGSTVPVMFRSDGGMATATVLGEGWSPAGEDDVAVLRLESPPPRSAKALSLGPSAGSAGHRFETFGFPAVKPEEGLWGYGTIGGSTTEKGRQVLQLTGTTEVTTGFSGGPVIDQATRRVVGMVTSITAPDPFGHLSETAFVTPAEVLQTHFESLQLSSVCPYRSLHYFEEAHQQFFFGRADVVETLLGKLHREPRFLAVLGPSGSGKSSVLRAGLIPRLRQSTRTLHLVDVRNYDAPLAGLTEARALLESLAPQGSDRILVLLDQFEDLLTLPSAGRRSEFIDALLDLIASSPDITVVIVMRDDYYPQLAAEAPTLHQQWVSLGLAQVPSTLSRSELVSIISEPAAAIGLRFEEGLVATIADDAIGEGGSVAGGGTAVSTILPLLQFTLTQLWERDHVQGTLTHRTYSELGRVAGGLTRWADETYHDLANAGHDALTRRVVTDLVELGDADLGLPDRRRRRSHADLLREAEEAPAVDHVVSRLADARLVVRSFRDGEERVVELIHDALLRDWMRLRLWLEEDRRYLLWRQEAERRAEGWVQSHPEDPAHRDTGRLLRGDELAEADQWALTAGGLPRSLIEYYQASVAERRREHRGRRRHAAVVRATAALALVIVVALIAFAVYVDYQREARRTLQTVSATQALVSQSRVLAERQPELAALLARQAYAFASNHESATRSIRVDEALQTSLGQRFSWDLPLGRADTVRNPVSALGFSADGSSLVASNGSSLRLWNPVLQAGKPKLIDNDKPGLGSFSTAVSPDLRIVAWVESAGLVLRNTENGTKTSLFPTASPTGLPEFISDLTFSHDGGRLAAIVDDNRVRIWVVDQPNSVDLELRSDGDLTSVVFSPDGQLLVGGGGFYDRKVRIWTLAEPQAPPVVLEGHEGLVGAAAFSTVEPLLATASDDGTLRIWNLADPTKPADVLRGHAGWSRAVAFSADGSRLASASVDDTVRVWRVRALNEPPLVLRGFGSATTALAFSPDGQFLATGTEGGTVRVTDLTDSPRAIFTRFEGHMGQISALAFGDGDSLVSGGTDDTIRHWDVGDPAASAPPTKADTARWLQFLPDGRLSFDADSDHGKQVGVRVMGRSVPRSPPELLVDPGSTPWRHSVLSADGSRLAVVTRDSAVEIREVGEGVRAPIVLLGPQSPVAPIGASEARFIFAMAISSDGRFLAVSGSGLGSPEVGAGLQDGVLLWDLTSSRLTPRFLERSENYPGHLGFSADSTTLAGAGAAGLLKVWFLEGDTVRAVDLTDSQRAYNAVALNPDGSMVAAARNDSTVWLWSALRKKPRLDILYGHTAEVTAVAFNADGTQLASGSEDRSVIVRTPTPLLARSVCRTVWRNMTRQEWADYVGNLPYERTCPAGDPKSDAARLMEEPRTTP